MIPAIGFVGYSNSGKTRVVANMIKIFCKRGYRVAAIKHASHGYDIDIPGKDSWQHYESGAEKVVLVGPSSYTIHQRCATAPMLNDILATISDIDIILIEGFKNETVPKVLIIREESQSEKLELNEGVVAIISDLPDSRDIPLFSFEQLDLLADFLINFLVLDK